MPNPLSAVKQSSMTTLSQQSFDGFDPSQFKLQPDGTFKIKGVALAAWAGISNGNLYGSLKLPRPRTRIFAPNSLSILGLWPRSSRPVVRLPRTRTLAPDSLSILGLWPLPSRPGVRLVEFQMKRCLSSSATTAWKQQEGQECCRTRRRTRRRGSRGRGGDVAGWLLQGVALGWWCCSSRC